MRPGQSCPGVAGVVVGLPADLPLRFNEAGAIMPRSGGKGGLDSPRDPQFASMRPGQSCPGVAKMHDRLRLHAITGFNEAGAIMPRSGSRVAETAEAVRLLQ